MAVDGLFRKVPINGDYSINNLRTPGGVKYLREYILRRASVLGLDLNGLQEFCSNQVTKNIAVYAYTAAVFHNCSKAVNTCIHEDIDMIIDVS